MLSVLAIAKSVPLFFKFANDCRCCLEGKQGLKLMWFPSSDRRRRGPVSGILTGFWVSFKSSQAHQMLPQVITLKMWQEQTLFPQGYVCFQMWNSTRKMGTFLSFFLSVPNGSGKEEEEGNLHIQEKKKKIHRNLLKYWSELGLDLLAFLLLHPDIHLTLCPVTMGRCGAEPSILKSSFKEREEQIPPSTLLFYWDFSGAGDRMTDVSMTESPQSCIREGPWARNRWQIYSNPTFTNILERTSASDPNYSFPTCGVFLHWVALWLLVRWKFFRKRLKGISPLKKKKKKVGIGRRRWGRLKCTVVFI